jgi:plastocyanin
LIAKWPLPVAAAAAATLGLLLVAVSGFGATPPPKPPESRVKVKVEDNFFDRRSVEVAQEGKVTWVWKGANKHNVRFTKVPKGASRKGSRTLVDGRWRRKFVVPGIYRYVCSLFAGMRGTVTVKVKAPPPSQ